jgi:DNA-binding CsgD family transcriptional regulator
MCSLLRMNLRSSEIARLFCLSERSVEGHRTHIRGKVKLKRGEDLMQYLARL